MVGSDLAVICLMVRNGEVISIDAGRRYYWIAQDR